MFLAPQHFESCWRFLLSASLFRTYTWLLSLISKFNDVQRISFFKDVFRNQVKDSPRGNVWNSRGWPTQMCLAHCVCSRAGGTGSGVLCVDTSRTYGKKRIIKWKRLGKFDRIKPAKKKYTKRTKYILIRAEATIVTQFYSVSPCRFESLARRRHADTHQNSLIMVMDSCPRQKETTWPLQVHVAIEKRPESMIFFVLKTLSKCCFDVKLDALMFVTSPDWSRAHKPLPNNSGEAAHNLTDGVQTIRRKSTPKTYLLISRNKTEKTEEPSTYCPIVSFEGLALLAPSWQNIFSYLPGTADGQTDPGCHHGRGEGARKSRYHNDHNAHDIGNGYNNSK